MNAHGTTKGGLAETIMTIRDQILEIILRLGSPELQGELQRVLRDIAGSIELDDDARNKREVYDLIATDLAERFSQPHSVCMAVTRRLCGETDATPAASLEGDRSVPPLDPDAVSRLEAKARDALIALKVHYTELAQFQRDQRRLEIFFLEPDGRSGQREIGRTVYHQELTWDRLPSEVREAHQRNQPRVTFKLYSKEA
jgi:hypothetical protein